MKENKGIVVVISVPCSLLRSKLMESESVAKSFRIQNFSGFGNEES